MSGVRYHLLRTATFELPFVSLAVTTSQGSQLQMARRSSVESQSWSQWNSCRQNQRYRSFRREHNSKSGPVRTSVWARSSLWLARLTNRSSGRVKDKVPSSNIGVRAAQLNR